ncbi:Proton-dependent oligopeptide transporter family [Penicillium mononematosum]|uniref:Proton-dependent oligopeptide transporter family n=1 Tax=Penicillium mononematosum TaxID=268346 RepID=UPI0025495CF8|nr:Proton-dependent oligopeptide transporter family [Penicillium mononematosum]KAJ6189898.1 Proton-dependent oligopeptide transporter family [Penicillium mononematosum]
MSDSMSDMHGSAAIIAEPNLQSRLVMAPEAHNTSDHTDACASLSFPKTEQDSGLSSEVKDHLALHASRSIPTPSDDDDGRVATEDEVRDLLHVVDKIPVRLWVACLAGILERFVWYGATAPLQNYLQNAPGGEVPGALGLHQATASNIVNALIIGSYIVPVPAAVVADSWLGRYKTMIYAAIIEAIGATVLFATSLPVAIHEGAALPGVITACILLAVGSGAFKTTVVPFIADQYDEAEFRIKTQQNGEKVVTSRELTITYIYNVFYWAINVVGFVADSTPLLERYVGFWLAYLIPCCAMWLALIPIIFGRKYFVRDLPTSNIMPQVCAALRYGITGGFKMDAAKPDAQLHQHGRQVPWTDSFVEEIKRSLLTCRVLLLFPIHWLCYNQTFNNLISQAGQMVTYGIPNDMMKIAGAISGIIVAPIIQKGLYPYLTKRRVTFGPIARMTVGFLFLALSMVYTTVVQKLIYQTGPCYDAPLACAAANDRTIPNQISVFLQVPTYFGGALAEVFCLTTGTEYAYNNAPKSMKTLVQAIWLAMAGIGTCLALAFTPLTKDPHLVTMYAILTGLLGGATILLWVLFRRLDKLKIKEDVE